MTREALARYARFAREKGWPVAEKLGLYRQGIVAFDGAADDATRRASHEAIYWNLRSYWKIGRKGTLMEAPAIFDLLAGRCGACSRESGLTLATLTTRQAQESVQATLETVRGIKRLRSGAYPVMAASKNLHPFNQRLWVVYDREVVVGTVYRVFKRDWDAGYRKIAVDTGDEGIDFYLAYLLWASQSIRNAYAGFMDEFADWFIQAVRDEGEEAEDFRGELQVSYATAFEFVVIGAAHLEGAGVPCLCR